MPEPSITRPLAPAAAPLRVAFLVGNDNASTRATIEAICGLSNIVPLAVLLDTGHASFRSRLNNLRRNVRIQGWRYILRRCLFAAREITESLASRAAAPPSKIAHLLRQAFPAKAFTLEDLGKRFHFSVHHAGNLNHSKAAEILMEADADLGIVLGTRILKPSIFTLPKRGCINLHKGKVPDYRGMPPGFWEIYDGAACAGVTVHFVDSGLDTGDILVAREIPIQRQDTPATLLEKLHFEGIVAICEAVAALRDGASTRISQHQTDRKARSKPSHADITALRSRLPHWHIESDVHRAIKNLYALTIYYFGIYYLTRLIHRFYRSRGVIILHHRINDYSRDPLTTDTATFAAHLVALTARYPAIPTTDLVRHIRNREPIPPTSIAIHFDDCYRDIFTHGAPLLTASRFPATAFINSGFIDTSRIFTHDAEKYPFLFPNLTTDQVREWFHQGFEIGNHTVNHVDLGQHPLAETAFEIEKCGAVLHAITGQSIQLFSFPFGRTENIRPEVVGQIRGSGYQAIFSAHGGFIDTQTDPFNIPRIGANGDLNPLLLLLEVEGIAPNQLFNSFR